MAAWFVSHHLKSYVECLCDFSESLSSLALFVWEAQPQRANITLRDKSFFSCTELDLLNFSK